MRAFGKLRRLPFVLAPSKNKNAPIIDADAPKQTVLVSHRKYYIVLKMAIPAETDPPGELMYSVISFFWSSFAR